MHSQAIPRPGNGRDQERLQRAVLALVLSEHPEQLTTKAVEERVGESVDLAIDALVGAGLLHAQDGLVSPTAAALLADRLA